MIPEIVEYVYTITKLFAPDKFGELNVIILGSIAIVVTIALEMTQHGLAILVMGSGLWIDKVSGLVRGEVGAPLLGNCRNAPISTPTLRVDDNAYRMCC